MPTYWRSLRTESPPAASDGPSELLEEPSPAPVDEEMTSCEQMETRLEELGRKHAAITAEQEEARKA